jgi:hypothetical protein
MNKMLKGGDRMTPKQLAAELGIDAKKLRSWLRKEHARDGSAKGTSWAIDAKAVRAARKHFAK